MSNQFKSPKLISELRNYRIPEDYLTCALLAILKDLLNVQSLKGDRKIAFKILNIIARKKTDPKWSTKENPVIHCQVKLSKDSRVDITITSKCTNGLKRNVIIEVKDRAKVDEGQLVKYKNVLDKDNESIYKSLVLLSRPLVQMEEKDKAVLNLHVYWHQVYKVISEISKSSDLSLTAKYILDSLIDFLKEKEMNLEEIEGTYANASALTDLTKLIAILKLALEGANDKMKGIKSMRVDVIGGEDPWFGWWFKYKDTEFTLGICTTKPNIIKLILENDKLNPALPNKKLDSVKKGIFKEPAQNQITMIQEFIIDKLPKLLEKSKVKH